MIYALDEYVICLMPCMSLVTLLLHDIVACLDSMIDFVDLYYHMLRESHIEYHTVPFVLTLR